MIREDVIDKKEFIEWIRDEGMKIYAELGHDRLDPYRRGIIDGYKSIFKKLKDDTRR